MRRRPGTGAGGNNDSTYNPYTADQQQQDSSITDETKAQIQTRRAHRETRGRLESQRQVEKSIAEV
eukprot:9750905-Ditylum_brightwellii.AAC.1